MTDLQKTELVELYHKVNALQGEDRTRLLLSSNILVDPPPHYEPVSDGGHKLTVMTNHDFDLSLREFKMKFFSAHMIEMEQMF